MKIFFYLTVDFIVVIVLINIYLKILVLVLYTHVIL